MPKIVVHPSGAESDLLPARDALTQILDFLDLLVHARPDNAESVVWLMKNITSNSPITAEILGAGTDPAIPVTEEAMQSMVAVEDGLDAAMEGRAIPHWMLNGAYNVAHRFFDRNTKSIGRTDITFDPPGAESTILIASAKARVALINLERAALEEEKKVRDWTHKAHGSIDGVVIDTTTFYGKPAIRLRERLSRRDIICVFDQMNADRIGDKYNWRRTWDHSRVRVEGLLHYDKAGDIVRVSDADVIDIAAPRVIDIAEFSDGTFTNGLAPGEYLERWRSRGRD